MSAFSIHRSELGASASGHGGPAPGRGLVRFDVKGFLDAHTFERMQDAIDDCFAEGRYRIIVNLEDVHYISSAGAGVFIGAIGTAQENDGNIVFLNPTENVKEVFDLLGLSLIFTFADDERQAIASFE